MPSIAAEPEDMSSSLEEQEPELHELAGPR